MLKIESLSGDHAAIQPIPVGLPAKGNALTDSATGLTWMRVSDIADPGIAIKAAPTAPPKNMNAPMDAMAGNPEAGHTNGYSKWPCVSPDGRFAFAFRTDNMVSVYELPGCVYKGTLAKNAFNAVTYGLDPRFIYDSVFLYRDGNNVFIQDAARGFASQMKVGTLDLLAGLTAMTNGGEGTSDDSGQYWPIIATGNGTAVTAVYDHVQNKVLPGIIDQKPNAIDISPSGRWLAMLPHTDPTLERNNRLYRISDLAAGITDRPVLVDSHILNGVRSIGHNGWAQDAQGNEVMIYQDNRDDFLKSFNPATGISTKIAHLQRDMGFWGKDGEGIPPINQHIARSSAPGLRGWALMSTNSDRKNTHWLANKIFLIETKPNPRVIVLGDTHNAHGGYFSEAFASLSADCKSVWIGANWCGASQLELYKLDISPVYDLLGGLPVEDETPVVDEPPGAYAPEPAKRKFIVRVPAFEIEVEEVE